nr:hypothetical protein [Tanacetum cinerariifolium]
MYCFAHEFKLPDENQVLLTVHRENNMYNVDLKNILPSGDLICLFAKAILDGSNLWHRMLGHINFKTMNKLVKVKEPEFQGKKPESEVHDSSSSSAQTKKHDAKTKREAKGKSHVELSTGYRNNTFSAVGPFNTADLRTLIILTRYTKWSRYYIDYIKLLELGLQVKQKQDGIFISQDKYVAEILRKFGLTDGKLASTPIDTEKPLLKDPDGEDADVYTYISMIGSLMYLTSLRPDIMFAVCICARFQVTPKASHLHAIKRTFRYLKGKLHLGLWYPKDLPFNLVAYSDSDYAGASLVKKSTTGGY